MKPPAKGANGKMMLNRQLKTDERWETVENDKGWEEDVLTRHPVQARDAELEAEMQRVLGGKRSKATARRKLFTQKALALRAQGEAVEDIALQLGVSSQTVTQWFSQHRRELDRATIDLELDQIAVPLATENLMHGLLAGDKDYTLETLKGRGYLRRHSDAKVHGSGDLPELVIRVEAPSVQQSAEGLLRGHIVGIPRFPEPRQITGTVVSSARGDADEPDHAGPAVLTPATGNGAGAGSVSAVDSLTRADDPLADPAESSS